MSAERIGRNFICMPLSWVVSMPASIPCRMEGMVSRNPNVLKSRRMGENARMHILLNGEDRDLDAGTNVAGLLVAEGMAERRVAVEVNGTIVPRGQHGACLLQAGDRVEIVHALGGG